MFGDRFRRHSEPSLEVASALTDLDRLARDRPELESAVRQLARVVAAVFSPGESGAWDDDKLREDTLVRMASRALEEGNPCGSLLANQLDRDAIQRRGMAACQGLRRDNPGAKSLQAALRADGARLFRWCEFVLTDRDDRFHEEVKALGLDLPLCHSLVRLVLLPGLSRPVRCIAPLDGIKRWQRAFCPYCGDRPTLAESRGLECSRFLRCGRCSGDWPAPRLQCVFCGEDSANALTTLAAEGEESRLRLVRCRSCGSGLKVLSTLSAISPPGLLVAELATVHLDFLELDETARPLDMP